MNNDYYYTTQIPRYRSYQLLSDTIRSYNQNIRLNHQQMIEYNRNMHDLIVILRDTMRPERIRRPTRAPPPTPVRTPFTLPRHGLSDIIRNYNPTIYSRNSIPEETHNSAYRENLTSNRRPRSRSLGDYINNSMTNHNTISSDSESEQDTNPPRRILDPSANANVRTFTTVPNANLSTSFHNVSRNSISTIYNLLMRDFDEIMGFNNFIETTNQNNGLTDEEKEIGLLDISYNVDIHETIDTHCPISLDDFQEGETITQIVECGHIFKTTPIMTWFERHTKCPKCRCELRMHSPSEPTDVSFNVVTPLQNMDANDIEREIDDITRRITNSMIEDINRNVEITINTDTYSNRLPTRIRERYINSQTTTNTNTRTTNTRTTNTNDNADSSSSDSD